MDAIRHESLARLLGAFATAKSRAVIGSLLQTGKS